MKTFEIGSCVCGCDDVWINCDGRELDFPLSEDDMEYVKSVEIDPMSISWKCEDCEDETDVTITYSDGTSDTGWRSAAKLLTKIQNGDVE